MLDQPWHRERIKRDQLVCHIVDSKDIQVLCTNWGIKDGK